jgi:hypothetical protein
MVRTHVGASVGVAVGMTVGDPVVPAAEAARSLYPVVDPFGKPRVPWSASPRTPEYPRAPIPEDPSSTPFAPAGAEPTLQRFCSGDLRMLEGYSSEIVDGVLK